MLSTHLMATILSTISILLRLLLLVVITNKPYHTIAAFSLSPPTIKNNQPHHRHHHRYHTITTTTTTTYRYDALAYYNSPTITTTSLFFASQEQQKSKKTPFFASQEQQKSKKTKANNKNVDDEWSFTKSLLDEFKTSSGEIIEPYNVLGVSRDADKVEIKKAYFKLCKKYHPDRMRYNNNILPGRCNNLEEVMDEFERIKFSYEILSDRRRRLKYDRLATMANPSKALQRAAFDFVGWGLSGIGKGLYKAGELAVNQLATTTTTTTTTATKNNDVEVESSMGYTSTANVTTAVGSVNDEEVIVTVAEKRLEKREPQPQRTLPKRRAKISSAVNSTFINGNEK